MYQYYIFIITKDNEGNYSHDVKWAFDQDAQEAKRKGESLYYSILSQAAISSYKHHAVTLLSADGAPIRNQVYVK